MMFLNIIILFNLWIQVTTSTDSILICESQTGVINCGSYDDIQVVDAIYGRTNSTVCPHNTVSVAKSYSCALSMFSTVSTSCNFMNTCSLSASNAGIVDPCINVYKYLNVSYNCINMDTTYINRYETTTNNRKTIGEITTAIAVTQPNSHTTYINMYETTTNNRQTIAERTTAIEVTKSNSLQCTCLCSVVGENKWGFLGSLNLTMEQMKTIMQSDLDALVQKIKINAKTTTKYLSTKYSASDDRKSSAFIGYVGLFVICMLFCGLFVIDLLPRRP